MAEQMGTPGSNADTSVNGAKTGAPKDKACPFCHQQFTSSSWGRHLDLYIKEKNPKPADGVHDVDEIRKMRGGITRRQPRVASWRREGSTPGGTPRSHDRRSPRPDSARGNRSPGDDGRDTDRSARARHADKGFLINQATWESTGVINVIPPTRNGDSAQSWDGDGDGSRRIDARSRSVSKQMLAKTAFEQKQKLVDAHDNAKAAELALRELLGSIRAAKQRIEGTSFFDYDPLTLDFPALCLHCLPPPPTLFQAVPIPNPSSWCINPPDDQQFQALLAHFASEFRRWRVSCAVATTAPTDDLSYPPPQLFAGLADSAELARQAEASASELESRISEHVHGAFAHWNSMPPAKRQEIWFLEMARTVGRKSQEIQKMKKDKESNQQEVSHLQMQIDELSRLQHPREFKLSSPTTVPVGAELMNHLSELGLKAKSVGFDIMDRHVHLDTAIERVIERWKGVVKEVRGNGSGLAAQRALSGENSAPTPASGAPASTTQASPSPLAQPPSPQVKNHDQAPIQNSAPVALPNHSNQNHAPAPAPPEANGASDMGSDADADADADMEDDDSYMEMNDSSHTRAPEASMGATANYRLTNGNGGQQNNNMGLENQGRQGYVGIRA